MNTYDAKVYQPTINIGMIGSVSNGKSCTTYQLSKKKTQQHSREQMRNITIKLGYANSKIFKCPSCPSPSCFFPESSDTLDANCELCGIKAVLQKHISVVDSPGHMMLMSTMLNGTSVMDATIVVESVSNTEMPSKQTREHMIAVELTDIPNCAICMNKIDLVKKDKAIKQLNKLQSYINTTKYSTQKSETVEEHKDNIKPIIPIAANYGLNIDVLCERICSLPEPVRDLTSNAKMIVIRSFNANRQDTQIKDMKGGVVGGSILKGVLKVGDTVKIFPGFVDKIKHINQEQWSWSYTPIISTVHSIQSEQTVLEQAVPGGLIGVALTVDPALTANDKLIGSVLVKVSTEDEKTDEYLVASTLYVIFTVIKRLDNAEITLKKHDKLTVNHNARNADVSVVKVRRNKAELKLIDNPVCVEINDLITISKDTGSGVEIVAQAKVVDVVKCTLTQ